VLNRHKLVFDRMVIEEDYRTAQQYDGDNKYAKTLVYQMTRISYDKGSIRHDDRLDALAIAVAYWTERMAMDADTGIKNEKERLLDQELSNFMDHVMGRGSGAQSSRWFSLRGR
jgi:hypothetical protein